MEREDRAVLIFGSLLLVCAVLAGVLDWQTEKQTLYAGALISTQVTAGLIGLTVAALRGSPLLIGGLLVFAHLSYGMRTQFLREAVFSDVLFYFGVLFHLLELCLAVWLIWRGAQTTRRK